MLSSWSWCRRRRRLLLPASLLPPLFHPGPMILRFNGRGVVDDVEELLPQLPVRGRHVVDERLVFPAEVAVDPGVELRVRGGQNLLDLGPLLDGHVGGHELLASEHLERLGPGVTPLHVREGEVVGLEDLCACVFDELAHDDSVLLLALELGRVLELLHAALELLALLQQLQDVRVHLDVEQLLVRAHRGVDSEWLHVIAATSHVTIWQTSAT